MANNKLVTCLWFDAERRARPPILPLGVSGQACRPAPCSGAGFSGRKQGDELTVEFTLLGQAFVGLNGGPEFRPNEAVSFKIFTDDQAETDRYWNAIVGEWRSGKRVQLVQGPMGFSWQIARTLMEGDGRIPTRRRPSGRWRR